MSQNFHKARICGKSFRGQNLTGANFSCADIRGADFTDAVLVGANFTNAKAGLQQKWVLLLIIASLLLALVAGIDAGYGSASVAVLITDYRSYGLNLLISIPAIFAIIIFCFVAIRRGWGAEVGGLSIILATIIVFVTAVGTHELLAEAVIQAVAISGTVAGIITATLSIAVINATAKKLLAAPIVLALFGVVCGALFSIPESNLAQQLAGMTGAALMAICVAGLGLYAVNRASTGDSRFVIIHSLILALCSSLGTSFRNANLTNSNFTQATLEHTDIRGATLTNTNWYQSKRLEYARVFGTYLTNLEIRKLVTTKNGIAKSYDNYDLRELNLVQADLTDASFIGANLSRANLQNADLSRAKLTQTQLYPPIQI